LYEDADQSADRMSLTPHYLSLMWNMEARRSLPIINRD